ncbi:MAG: hypothetical protein J6P20_06915, partial [Oscillospiraceae bacterium]|nr:hypothetical protein [Oscillospiraceae bacterium]
RGRLLFTSGTVSGLQKVLSVSYHYTIFKANCKGVTAVKKREKGRDKTEKIQTVPKRILCNFILAAMPISSQSDKHNAPERFKMLRGKISVRRF